MATLAVACFVLVAYTVVVGGDPGPTPGDETARNSSDTCTARLSTSVAKVVTFARLGGVVWALAAICAALLAWRRRWAEFWVLVAGMAIDPARHRRDQGRGRPAAPAGPARLQLAAPPSPAATPPTRSSTSGWR